MTAHSQRTQRSVRLTTHQDTLWRRLLIEDDRWPSTWTVADRLAWVLEWWGTSENARFPRVEEPPR